MRPGPEAAALALLAAALAPRAAGQFCRDKFYAPKAPVHAADHNGVALDDVCLDGPGPHHVFVIGDWGGVIEEKKGPAPQPADCRQPQFSKHRPFIDGVDDKAQQRVADQMRLRAPVSKPDYILNVGDNFYWGGLNTDCGAETFTQSTTDQWGPIFEWMYNGPGLDGKQWLGVLGNHDYGGYMFTAGWDQAIGYTWATGPPSTGRWMTPAQYWRVKVRYSDFSVDYFFVDSNAFDASDPVVDPAHNMCGQIHNKVGASCGPQGPTSIYDCPGWFARLWDAEQKWLHEGLSTSFATWQVIVTHFPPMWGTDIWKNLTASYGVDLLVTGHTHKQEVHYMLPGDVLNPTAWIISGGGGGITSEGTPSSEGLDDEYGFMDLTFTKDEIIIEPVSHGGTARGTTKVRRHENSDWSTTTSTSTTITTTTITTTFTTTSTTTWIKLPSWTADPGWQAIDGGIDRACRGTNETPGCIVSSFRSHEAGTLGECRDTCVKDFTCRGLEFTPLSKVCKIWRHEINATVEFLGTLCLQYSREKMIDDSRAATQRGLSLLATVAVGALVLGSYHH